MRETKFRVWNKLNNKLETVVKIFYPEEGDNIGVVTKEVSEFGAVKEHYLLKGEYELMQFTGLHDKNGNEIYEGDVVYNSYDYGPYAQIKRREVISFDGYLMHEGVGHECFGVYFDAPIEYYQVIGNIYENPELTNQSYVL